MSKLTVTAYTTLDNVAGEPHWTVPFFSEEGAGKFNDGVLQEADALLLGRVTYEGFAAAWPSRSGDTFSDTINAMPKYVVSSSLERADWHNSTILDEDVLGRVGALKADQNVLVWGSPTLVQSLMEHDLVDEYVLLVSPIVRAEGIRLFADGGAQHDLHIAEARLLEGGMLALRMTPARA